MNTTDTDTARRAPVPLSKRISDMADYLATVPPRCTYPAAKAIIKGQLETLLTEYAPAETTVEQVERLSIEKGRLLAQVADLLAALEALVARAEGIDARLLKTTGSVKDCELGEIVQARRAIAAAKGARP